MKILVFQVDKGRYRDIGGLSGRLRGHWQYPHFRVEITGPSFPLARPLATPDKPCEKTKAARIGDNAHPLRSTCRSGRCFQSSPNNVEPQRTRQRHSCAGHGRCTSREFRSSRHAHGHGRHRRSAVERFPQAQPDESAVGQSRSFRAFQWPRFDVDLRVAAPDRLRPAAAGVEELPPTAFKDCRSPRIRRDPRRRDHHRAARPGPGQRRRHGPCRTGACRALQSRRSRHCRSPHLCLPRRRLPDGRHFTRGRLAGRHPRPWQARRHLGRQRHLHRWRGRRLVHR